MRVLMSAYACEPDKGSEPGVGWHWAKQAARFHEVWVITRANNRPAIEAELKRHPVPNLHFIYVDLPRWLTFWKRGPRGLYLYYYLWQLAAYRRARTAHREIGFDITHHVTFGNNWLPTFLPLLPVPFVWGPIGGAETVPKAFRKDFSFKWRLYEGMRDFIQKWILRFDPVTRFARQNAKVILARTQIMAEYLRRSGDSRIEVIIETGANPHDKWLKLNNKECINNKYKVVMAGRILHLKGFHLGIQAFHNLGAIVPHATLEIIGAGPEQERLYRLCQDLGLGGKVNFTGWLSQEEALRRISQADVFLHPSLKDGGAWVLFEVLELGIPVICLDYAGPGEVINNICGLKVKADNPEQVVQDLAKAMEMLATDINLRERLRAGTQKRVRELAWDKKGEFLKYIYGICCLQSRQRL